MSIIQDVTDSFLVKSSKLDSLDNEIIRKDLTFLRVVLDEIHIGETDDSLKSLFESKGLYGFILEYKFPVLESVSKTLKDRVQANAKSYSNRCIHFRHRRVFKLSPENKLWALWKESSVRFLLYGQLNAPGKFTASFSVLKKRLGHCDVPLYKLLTVPFAICQDFLFAGLGFTGSANLRIELGSHVRSLMERLDALRFHRSRQPSKSGMKKAVKSLDRSNITVDKQQERRRSVPYTRSSSGHSLSPVRAMNGRVSSASPSCSASGPQLVPQQTLLPENYTVDLTVHSARRLSSLKRKSGEAAPSTYVSVIANDGHVLYSPLCINSYEPKFNWTQSFEVSSKRQNLVVKLWRKCSSDSGKVIGFVSIPLPPKNLSQIEYEMSSLVDDLETPIVKISLALSNDQDTPESLISSSSLSQFSREEISERLKKDLFDLEILMQELQT
ncbi:unnamed protein product [Enterobius vermicularis]|uniref:C2 domain-containing protein n=1 Tax=Enterobius vermicularis TaxID=51028 RepID=A0A0N4VGG1_ENTVE|nr:unnamed protein product [Enterobius vermicularis]